MGKTHKVTWDRSGSLSGRYLTKQLQQHLLARPFICVMWKQLPARVRVIQVLTSDDRLVDQLTLAVLQDRNLAERVFCIVPVRLASQVNIDNFMSYKAKGKAEGTKLRSVCRRGTF